MPTTTDNPPPHTDDPNWRKLTFAQQCEYVPSPPADNAKPPRVK